MMWDCKVQLELMGSKDIMGFKEIQVTVSKVILAIKELLVFKD